MHIDDGFAVDVCMYRTDDGNKCAIGCLIPDELYSEAMERSTVGAIIEGFPQIKKFFEDCNPKFLERMQSVHDYVGNWDDTGFTPQGLKELDSLARTYGLKVVDE